MLEGILKHDKLGSKDELLLFLFDGVSERGQTVTGLKTYCTTQLFSIGRSFNGIMALCQFIGFVIRKEDNTVIINDQVFTHAEYVSNGYFDQSHFFQHLLQTLKKHGAVQEMFNDQNVKFNQSLNRYYVVENKFPYRYFLLRNLLLSTGFFERDTETTNHLLIKSQFTELFRSLVIDGISVEKNRRRMSLHELKLIQQKKEDAGAEAEEFVLAHERSRLTGHPCLEKVIIISEDDVTAGYDVHSYNDLDSIIIDRFIEVKSFTKDISFYWSKNEVATAKTLRGKYHLYLVDRSKMKDPGYEPKKFEDPYQKIFENDFWMKEITNWRITLED